MAAPSYASILPLVVFVGGKPLVQGGTTSPNSDTTLREQNFLVLIAKRLENVDRDQTTPTCLQNFQKLKQLKYVVFALYNIGVCGLATPKMNVFFGWPLVVLLVSRCYSRWCCNGFFVCCSLSLFGWPSVCVFPVLSSL